MVPDYPRADFAWVFLLLIKEPGLGSYGYRKAFSFFEMPGCKKSNFIGFWEGQKILGQPAKRAGHGK